ncbi:MAG TPA: N-acetylmuramoyl-L-alanine amidase [Xanthobacteraceae bacterium]|nr:N-acetylmuramoyl-L-alanine amidase [Xanthobacteraceae bacterium]
MVRKEPESRLSFRPDSRLVSDVAPSPNHDARAGGRAPDMLLLHYTGMQSTLAAIARLRDENAPRVSSHYLIDEEGTILQLVPEARRAWHAGVSRWAGESDINSCSIGIEIANPGHDFGYADFPPHQIATVVALCKDILARHKIPAARVLAHSDVAPGRKQDPGEKFPWPELHQAGIGHWVSPLPLTEGGALSEGDSGDEVRTFQQQLAAYGYGIEAGGQYDFATRDVVAAFQRHFRPARVDGVADASTRRTLSALLESLPR